MIRAATDEARQHLYYKAREKVGRYFQGAHEDRAVVAAMETFAAMQRGEPLEYPYPDPEEFQRQLDAIREEDKERVVRGEKGE
jgi:hypothetical protein